jgi:hypothetical protein
MENNWYIYQEDVYGVNGLLTFSSKQNLIKFVNSEDFMENSMPEGISENTPQQIEEASNLFTLNTIDYVEYAKALLEIIETNNGDITNMYIEDFESLCEGKSAFGKMAVTYFYEIKKLNPINHISNELKEKFRYFLDNADGVWVG